MAPERDIHLETFWIYFGEKWIELRKKNLKIPTQSARGTCLRVEAGIIEEAKGKNWVWEGACENLEHLAIRKAWTVRIKRIAFNRLFKISWQGAFLPLVSWWPPLSQSGVCESVMTPLSYSSCYLTEGNHSSSLDCKRFREGTHSQLTLSKTSMTLHLSLGAYIITRHLGFCTIGAKVGS